MNTSVIAYYKGDISDALKDDRDIYYNHHIYQKIVEIYIDKKNDGYIRSSVEKHKANIVKLILSSYDDFIKEAKIYYKCGNYISIIFKKKCLETSIY